MSLSLEPHQLDSVQRAFAAFASSAKLVGVTDQDIAEWCLSVSARWLHAHGVSLDSIHTWLENELKPSRIVRPLVAAAAAKNDFGGRRH